MTVLTLAAGGGFAITLLRAIGRPVPLWLLALPLPLSAAVNLLVKRPIFLGLAVFHLSPYKWKEQREQLDALFGDGWKEPRCDDEPKR